MSPTPSHDLLSRGAWVFDMDGTLTIAMHDFDGMRRELGLPEGRPILEALSELPPEVHAAKRRRLDEMELELAQHARLADGAHELLSRLAGMGARLGILTRNTRAAAAVTLEAVGLAGFFADAHVLGRDEAAPKPSPDGIHKLLSTWRADAGDSVMVGDFLFDLYAGRDAGAATVYVDPTGAFPHAHAADVSVRSLLQLL